MHAKIEAVLGAIAMVFAPFVAVLAFASPFDAAVAAIGILHCGGVRDRDPALVPRAGQAQPFPAPADLLTARDLCGGLLLRHLGRHRRLGGGRHLACAVTALIAIAILAGPG